MHSIHKYILFLSIALSVLLLKTAFPSPAVTGGEKTPQAVLDRYPSLFGEDETAREEAIDALAKLGDPNILPILEALFRGDLYLWTRSDGTVFGVITGDKIDQEGKSLFPLYFAYGKEPMYSSPGNQVLAPLEELNGIEAGRALRGILKKETDFLRMTVELNDPDPQVRRSAATRVGNEGDPNSIPVLENKLSDEPDGWVRYSLQESIYRLELNSEDPGKRKEALERLGELRSQNALPTLKEWVKVPAEGATAALGEEELRIAEDSIRKIESWERFTRWVAIVFSGLSLGSILMLMALGLAIIFGLMGVINMAHGELMMLGAYTTYVIQGFFQTHIPASWFGFYFLLSLPLSFLVVGGIGWCLEKGVIRHLYGRPLETLLVTWGLSLILQQGVRQFFGAANVDLISPDLLRNGIQVAVGIYFPYNRLFIIGLTAAVVFAVYYLLMRSHTGLIIQAVTQNREMSMCLGISSGKVDAFTFALGAGLAGMAGCALTLIGNVGPDLGQNYIVDSFMVVVFGGVGKLAGTILAAIGIGGLNKLIEPTLGAVFGKVVVLVLLIIFLQKKPSGLFPAKGRYADA